MTNDQNVSQIERAYGINAVLDIMESDTRQHGRQYSNKRSHGEWFALTPEDIAEICSIPGESQ
jgi:hypothetical protein